MVRKNRIQKYVGGKSDCHLLIGFMGLKREGDMMVPRFLVKRVDRLGPKGQIWGTTCFCE